jgi:hypothetical protein
VSAVLTPVRLALIDGFAPMSQATDAIIYVGDQVTDPIGGPANAYAYHSIIAGQAIPYGFVYRDACDTLKRPWSAALSHEVLEMLVDPQLSCSKIGPAPAGSPDAGQSVSFECEVCDPTEADTYPINGVCVSNFVTKAYFAQAQTGVPTNKLNLPLAPFGVRPGGYVQYQIAGNVRQYPLAAGAQIIARRMLGPWRRNARRADRAALAEVVRSNFAKL